MFLTILLAFGSFDLKELTGSQQEDERPWLDSGGQVFAPSQSLRSSPIQELLCPRDQALLHTRLRIPANGQCLQHLQHRHQYQRLHLHLQKRFHQQPLKKAMPTNPPPNSTELHQADCISEAAASEKASAPGPNTPAQPQCGSRQGRPSQPLWCHPLQLPPPVQWPFQSLTQGADKPVTGKLHDFLRWLAQLGLVCCWICPSCQFSMTLLQRQPDRLSVHLPALQFHRKSSIEVGSVHCVPWIGHFADAGKQETVQDVGIKGSTICRSIQRA
eukprot:s194_g5.t1